MNVTPATLSVQSCLSLLGWVGFEIEGGGLDEQRAVVFYNRPTLPWLSS